MAHKKTGLILVLLLGIQLSDQVSVNKFLSINGAQKVKLIEFRRLVSPRLPHDYMKKDVELIRWLRDSDFDIATAERRILDDVVWREENGMDFILDEDDWSDFEDEYRVTIEGCDREGKLVISVRVGDWNLRRAILSGQGKRMERFFDKLFEEASVMVRKMRDDGQNITQPTMIFDMGTFNLIEQGCLRCLPIYLHMLVTVQDHFPGVVHRIVAVNTPQIAIPLWNIVKNAVPKKISDLLLIYGRDRKEWMKALFEEIDKDQLTVDYGGNKEEGVDMQELRNSGKLYKCSNV